MDTLLAGELEGPTCDSDRHLTLSVRSGETLIVPVPGRVGELASIYSFKGTGSLIWQLLDEPGAIQELVGAVERE
jgi:hypothetical protein